MLRILFLKPITVSAIETKMVDGEVTINEFEKSFDNHFTVAITSMFPTEKISQVNLMVETENSTTIYQNIDLSLISILKGDIPEFLQSKSPPDKPPPCGTCGKK